MTQIQIEGEHVGFTFQADYTYDPALKIYQVKGQELEIVWDPCDRDGFLDTVGGHLDPKALKYLQKRGVRKMFTPGHPDDLFHIRVETFLGNQLSWYYDKNNWGSYFPLTDDYRKYLGQFGIDLAYLREQYSTSQR